METKTTHFTNFAGYIEYREGFEELPREEWTDGEAWIHEQEMRIQEWRDGE